MSETSQLQTWITTQTSALSALTTRVVSLENSRTADEAAFKALAAQLGVDEGKIAALLAAAGIPAPIPIPVPPPPTVDPQIKWKATMDTGDLSEWLSNGDEENTGSADTTVLTAIAAGIPAYSGAYVMRQAVTGASGGTRMQRYPEVDALCRAGTKFYWSWRDYFPGPVSFDPSGMWQIWGAMSYPTATFGAPNDVFFSLGFQPSGNTLRLTYNPTGRANTTPKVDYTNSTPVPVGRWNFFEVEFLPRGDKTGSFRQWMNGALMFELLNTQTQYPLIGQQPLLTVIEQTGYGDVAYAHFVDSVTLSLGRVAQ